MTPTQTFTPTPTFTPTFTPTNIQATGLPPTWTPTTLPGGSADIGSQGLVITGVVNVSDAVNVRDNPSRSGKAIGSLKPRSTVQIIGRNEDGTWLQIKMEDGTEGWVSAQFIRINEPGTGTPTPVAYEVDPNAYVSLLSDSSYQRVDVNLQTSPEPTLTLTVPAPATLVAPAAAPLPAQGAAVTKTPYRDQRWYAMTLGLLAIIGIITLGAIINIVRGLFRRGRK
jgi:SH3-like domain-containing protein